MTMHLAPSSRTAVPRRLRSARRRLTGAHSMAALSAAFLLITAGCSAEAPNASAPDGQSGTTMESLSTPIILADYGWQAAWADVGSPFGAAPALASWGPGRVDLFMKNADQLIQKTRTTSAGWMPAGDHYWYIASGLASDPSAVGWKGKNLDVVFRASGNNVIHVYWNGSGSWIAEDLQGAIDGKPTISVAPDGTRMDVFARVGNKIWHRGWAGFINSWGNWENLNLTTDSDPVAVSWGRGHVDLFYRATNGETRRYTWNGPNAAWTLTLANQPWVTQPSLGGFAKGPPAVASQGAGGLDVLVQGGDDGIYRNRLGASGSFSGWTRIPSCTYGSPAVAESDTLHVVVREKNTHRILHNFESLFPSSASGASPMCCGLTGQRACSVSGCDSTLAAYQNGLCGQCGYVNEPACLRLPTLCQPGLGLDSDAYCRVCPPGTATFGGLTCRPPQVLNASKSLDDSIHVDVSLRAVETGGFAIHPHATNYNQITGFMYEVDCHVGAHEIAYVGHVGPSSLLGINGPGRDDAGIHAVQDPKLAADWPAIAGDWQAGIGTANFDCRLSTQSTLAQSFNDLWATISGVYMSQFGVDDLAQGHLCLVDCRLVGQCDWICSADVEAICSPPNDDQECGSAYFGL